MAGEQQGSSQLATVNQNGVIALNSIDASLAAIAAKFPDWVPVPSTATSSGTAGQVAYEPGYLYVCVATNTWGRTALTTF